MSDLPTKLEFEIQDINDEHIERIQSNLNKKRGIKTASIDVKEKKVFVETTLPSGVIQKQIEREFNSFAVLRGMGTQNWTREKQVTSAAVSIIKNFDERLKPINGVIRFVQLDENNCAIDGTVDGLTPGFHSLNICEFGDISKGCESTGNHFNPYNKKHGLPPNAERHAGDLGNIKSNSNETAQFRMVDQLIKVWDIIGRSVCIYERDDRGDGDAGQKIACGIVARSAGLFENKKKICLCSGKTLWEERDEINNNQQQQQQQQQTQSKI